MNKTALRVRYKGLRQSLTKSEIETMSLAIANQLLSLPIWDKTYFHVFLPIAQNNEVNTEFILHLLAGKDKEIVISKSDFETTTMHHFLLTDNTIIKKNQHHIPEPVSGLNVPTAMIQVVFVPLLAFDVKGHRVGYGKGFYDKFLSECAPETIKIGLSFFEIEPIIADVFETDVRLDYGVTPIKVYAF